MEIKENIEKLQKPQLKTKKGIPYEIISHEKGANRHDRRMGEALERTEKSRTRKQNIFFNQKDMANRKRKAIVLKIEKKKNAKIQTPKM